MVTLFEVLLYNFEIRVCLPGVHSALCAVLGEAWDWVGRQKGPCRAVRSRFWNWPGL